MQKPNLKKVKGIRLIFDGVANFTFIIDDGIKSETFLTNEEIRRVIEDQGLIKGAGVGEIFFDLSSGQKTAFWESYYPVKVSTLRPYLTKPDNTSDFFKKGINQELELMAIKRLKKSNRQLKFFQHKINFHSPVSQERIDQLEKRGILEKEMYSGYSYRRARRRLSKKIQDDKRKAKTEVLHRRPLRRL